MCGGGDDMAINGRPNENETILKLLRSRRDKLRRMIDITQSANLTPTQDSLEDYALLIGKREILLNEILDIEGALGQNAASAFGTEARQLDAEAKALAEQFMVCDRALDVVRQGILSSIKQDMQDFSRQKKAGTQYHQNGRHFGFSQFDKQK